MYFIYLKILAALLQLWALASPVPALLTMLSERLNLTSSFETALYNVSR